MFFGVVVGIDVKEVLWAAVCKDSCQLNVPSQIMLFKFKVARGRPVEVNISRKRNYSPTTHASVQTLLSDDNVAEWDKTHAFVSVLEPLEALQRQGCLPSQISLGLVWKHKYS